jgi:4-hydroxy-2-oxoheptanedioate aldolase
LIENRLKSTLRQGKVAVGSWVTLSDPSIVEMMALAGYDYCGIMMEHSALDYSMVENMIRAAEVAGISSLVRVAENREDMILRVMEMGAGGVMVPHVKDAESAARAVQAVKYAPVGARGMNGMTRAARWTAMDFAEHLRTSNEQSVLVVMVEDAQGIDRIDEILRVDGIDVVFLGPNDLARSYGVPAQPSPPEVRDAVERAAEAAKTIGKAQLGLPVYHPSFHRGYGDLVRMGVRFMTHSTDATVLLRAWREELRKLRQGDAQ